MNISVFEAIRRCATRAPLPLQHGKFQPGSTRDNFTIRKNKRPGPMQEPGR